MPLLRKILAVLSALAGVFFGLGVLLMPPPHLGALIVLAVVAGVLILAAPLLWPRKAPLALNLDRRLS